MSDNGSSIKICFIVGTSKIPHPHVLLFVDEAQWPHPFFSKDALIGESGFIRALYNHFGEKLFPFGAVLKVEELVNSFRNLPQRATYLDEITKKYHDFSVIEIKKLEGKIMELHEHIVRLQADIAIASSVAAVKNGSDVVRA